jgi:hypothetical protein
MRLRIETCVLPALFLALAVCSFSRADGPPKPAQRSTDDVLRDSLNSQSGDDYDRALLGEPAKAKAGVKDRKTESTDKKLVQELGPAMQRVDQQEDRLLQAVKGMRDVQTRLAQGKSDVITQQVQRQVVADLQQIIDEAKKSGKCLGQSMACSCKSPGKPDASPNAQSKPDSASDQPARESSPKARQEPKSAQSERQKTAHNEMNQQYKIELQSRQHDTMFENPSEYFLPEYEREIEDYFRRLSQGRPIDEKP